MPRYYEDKPEGGACSGVKEDLGACLLQSDCVLKQRPASMAERELFGLVFSGNFFELSLPKDELISHQALADLLSEEGKTPRQCLKEGSCKALQYSFFECKRSMLDARSRFRGRKGY